MIVVLIAIAIALPVGWVYAGCPGIPVKVTKLEKGIKLAYPVPCTDCGVGVGQLCVPGCPTQDGIHPDDEGIQDEEIYSISDGTESA